MGFCRPRKQVILMPQSCACIKTTRAVFFAYLLAQKWRRYHLKLLHCLCFTNLLLQIIWINHFMCLWVMCSYHFTRATLNPALQPYNKALGSLLILHESQWKVFSQECIPGVPPFLTPWLQLGSVTSCFQGNTFSFFFPPDYYCLWVLTLRWAKLAGDPLGGLGCRLRSGWGSRILVGLSFGPFNLERKQIYVKHHSLDFKQRGWAALCASRIFTVVRQDDICPLQIINKGWVSGIGFIRLKLIT